MHINLDTCSNKQFELEAIIAMIKLGVVGLTEIDPHNATWELTDTEMKIPFYIVYSNFSGRSAEKGQR